MGGKPQNSEAISIPILQIASTLAIPDLNNGGINSSINDCNIADADNKLSIHSDERVQSVTEDLDADLPNEEVMHEYLQAANGVCKTR